MKEEKEEDTLGLFDEELQNKLQNEATCLIETRRLCKIVEKKDRLNCVKVSSHDYKYRIVSKTLCLKV